jgi:hypothetical protein
MLAKPTPEVTAQDFSFIMATNVESTYHVSQLAYPLMKESGGGDNLVTEIKRMCWRTSPIRGVPLVLGGESLGLLFVFHLFWRNGFILLCGFMRCIVFDLVLG